MDMTEKQLSCEYKFRGRIMTARVDEVSLPNGKTAPREVCEHVGGVGVLPIVKDGNVILVRQFRYLSVSRLFDRGDLPVCRA